MKDAELRHRLLTVGMFILCLLAWRHPLLLPLRMFVVALHEAGHAVTAILTGGTVLSISVGANEGGRTVTEGGSRFLILNGGYLGSLLMGMALLASTRTPSRGRLVAGMLGMAMLGMGVAWVPFISLGFLLILTVSLGLGYLAWKGPSAGASAAVRVLGVFSVLYALFDIRDDVLLAQGEGMSDAAMLAQVTGLPALLWGVAWLAMGMGLLWRLRHRLI